MRFETGLFVWACGRCISSREVPGRMAISRALTASCGTSCWSERFLTRCWKRAKDRCDKLIAAVRQEYADTLVRIAALEQDLLGRQPSTHKTASSFINRAIPSDRPFTALDVVTTLEGMEPGRVWLSAR